ncbi:hypothetical protein [Actinomadura parmotrematis]|uniref:CHAD domain-containing protein n=1 Tax=Actinomadura parmotrematis TaxID=2864039 RepID=A0ABS7FSB0_9ACTN|nr:hypothetical protein [Actinomadura parmotrematis]MBW8482408.1 hypothetical protein [Actinomadura parmotrematis]
MKHGEERGLLRAAAALARVRELYGGALTAPDEDAERRLYADLAVAAQRLSDEAQALAGEHARDRRPRTRTRLRRRIAGAERTADRIIHRTRG